MVVQGSRQDLARRGRSLVNQHDQFTLFVEAITRCVVITAWLVIAFGVGDQFSSTQKFIGYRNSRLQKPSRIAAEIQQQPINRALLAQAFQGFAELTVGLSSKFVNPQVGDAWGRAPSQIDTFDFNAIPYNHIFKQSRTGWAVNG